MKLFFQILAEFGLPVAAALIMGFFIYLIIKYILESVIGQVKTMHAIITMLDNRVKTMNHDMIRLDLLISHSLNLKPDEDKFMTVNSALEILEQIEDRKKEGLIAKDTLVIGCARLGSDDFIVKSGKLSEIKKFDFGKPLHCLIIPGKMHFMEEEMLRLWSDQK